MKILTRPVHIGEAQRDSSKVVDLAVQAVVVLAGQLVDAVDVARLGWVRLINWQVSRPPVHLAGTGVYDHHFWPHSAKGFQQHQLRTDVDVLVAQWIHHRLVVADLPGDVEDEICTVQ